MKSNMHRHILQSLSKAVIAAGLSVAISLVAAEESTDITEPTPPAFGSIHSATNPFGFFQPVETADAPESDLTPEDSEDESIAPVSTEAQPNNPTITEPAAITDEEVAGANPPDNADHRVVAASDAKDSFANLVVDATAQPVIATEAEEYSPTSIASESDDLPVRIKYENMDVDEVLKQYSEWTGRALMKAPDVPAAKITLKCPTHIPKREALLAIEGILGMHGIALVPMGDKFLKVVPIGIARQSGMPTLTGPLDDKVSDTGHLVSRIMPLKHLEITEAQTTLQNLVSPNGKIIPLERINCLMITDTAVNLKRIAEVLELIDLPVGSREEFRIFQIRYAKASEIQGKIEAIIADTKTTDNRVPFLRQQQLLAARMPFQRPGQPPTPGATPTTPGEAMERSLIQGKVKIVADDRTNILIIITRPDQFAFFDDIISALDKQVEPDVAIKVIRLEYADAEKVVDVLNNLVGASKSSTSAKTPADTKQGDSRTRQLPPSFPQPDQAKAASRSASGEISIEGRLSDDVKIIADPRINALLILASKSDMAIIEDVLSKVDIMLSQVLIEAVIIEVNLDENTRMGVDWLQRSMIAYNAKQQGGRRSLFGFSGTSRAGTDGVLQNATAIRTIGDSPAGAASGLTYYFTLFDLNIDAVLNMLASSSDARILSTPIILTTDNTEAKILVGERRPIITSSSMSSGQLSSGYSYTDIGIELVVTPRINKKGFVVMDIKQTIDNVGGEVTIDQNSEPIITTRELNASVAINDGRTIVLGGLVSTEEAKGNTGIPFLRRIPLLGMLFRSESSGNARRELLVMITPHVLDTPERVSEETARRNAAISKGDADLNQKGWGTANPAGPDAEQKADTKSQPDTESELAAPTDLIDDDAPTAKAPTP
jgi:general secretion pathway protein D